MIREKIVKNKKRLFQLEQPLFIFYETLTSNKTSSVLDDL